MSKLKVLAVSNGPIFKTLQKARSLRELWAASYFLSKISEIEISMNITGATLLSPKPLGLAENEKLNGRYFKLYPERNGAACYPERVYWEIPNFLSNDQLNSLNQKVYEKIGAELNNTISIEDIKSYVCLYWLQMEFETSDPECESFLFQLNSALDGLDLQQKWNNKNHINIISHLIGKESQFTREQRPVYRWRIESSQGDELLSYANGLHRFPSMLEIATKGLVNTTTEAFFREHVYEPHEQALALLDNEGESSITYKNKEKEVQNISLKIKDEIGSKFLEKDNYICIIYSDGDNIGRFLREQVQNNTGEFGIFSKKLNAFSTSANQLIKNFKGLPVFAGGDDLLFLCPMTNYDVHGVSNNTFIDLLISLDDLIKQQIPDLSLSFGVAITHYKHPLDQSLQLARDLLFNNAKKNISKNQLAVQFEKHSGSAMKFQITMSSDYDSLFMKFHLLLKQTIKLDDQYLKSFMYKLARLRYVIEAIYIQQDVAEVNNNYLRNMFNNYFNEDEHKDYRENELFDENKLFGLLRLIIDRIYSDSSLTNEEDKYFKLYSILKFCEFFIANDHGD